MTFAEFILSTIVGILLGFVIGGGYVLYRRALDRRGQRPYIIDCVDLHRTAAAEKTVYSKVVSPDVQDHVLICTRYETVPDGDNGWRVVGLPVGEKPRLEYLCEHEWGLQAQGVHEQAKPYCVKCGVYMADAYRLPTIPQAPFQQRIEHSIGTHDKKHKNFPKPA